MTAEERALIRLAEAISVVRKVSALAPLETRLERALGDVFRRQRLQFVARLRKYRGRFALQEAEQVSPLSEAEWEAEYIAAALATARPMAHAIDRAARQSLTLGIQHSRIDLNSPEVVRAFGPKSPAAVQVMRERGAARVVAINETTRSRLRSVLTEAVRSGWTYTQTEGAIVDLFAGFSTSSRQHLASRARLIAVSEVSSAYEEGRRLIATAIQTSGEDLEKQWVTQGIDRVCAICLSGEDQGWVSLDQLFDNGFDGPPGHPGCRCTTAYQTASAS